MTGTAHPRPVGRPAKADTDRVSTTFRISPELLARVDAEASRRVIGRNLLLVTLIERALPVWERAVLGADPERGGLPVGRPVSDVQEVGA